MSAPSAKKEKTVIAVEHVGPYTVEVSGSAKGAGNSEVKVKEAVKKVIKGALNELQMEVKLAAGERLAGAKRTRGGARHKKTRKHRSSRKRSTRRRR